MIQQPVFLVGAERSGTTMLHLMLDGHPDISFGEEFEYSVEFLVESGHRAGAPWPDLDAYRAWLATDRVFLLHDQPTDGADSYPELVDGFLARLTDEPSDARVRGATVHFGIEHLLELWPDARFIHVVRDPRDIAPSHIRMGFAGNAWHALDKWLAAEDAISEIKSSLANDRARIITVRFDRLVSDYRGELERLMAFLGLTFSPQLLDYPNHTDYELPQVAETWTRTSPLSDRDTQLVEARVGARLTEHGFEPSGLPAMTVSAWQRRWLAIDNKLRRPARRATVVGWPQVIAEIIAVRLPGALGERLQTSVFARSNATINSHRRKSWA